MTRVRGYLLTQFPLGNGYDGMIPEGLPSDSHWAPLTDIAGGSPVAESDPSGLVRTEPA